MKSFRFSLLTAAFVGVLPSMAMAHPGHGVAASWTAGFAHPFLGLDHMAAMVAVGVWAACQHGKGRWALPLTFLAAMTVGGIVGASGVVMPGVEIGIGLSVLVLGALAILRLRVRFPWAVATVSAFAVFHGFAHGQEMPATGQFLSYGLGFLLATALLHAGGFAVPTLVAMIRDKRLAARQ